MISAGLQLDVLADINIFLEREGGNIFEWKHPFLTNLPFMQEAHKNGKILSRQTLLHPHHTQLHIIQGFDPRSSWQSQNLPHTLQHHSHFQKPSFSSGMRMEEHSAPLLGSLFLCWLQNSCSQIKIWRCICNTQTCLLVQILHLVQLNPSFWWKLLNFNLLPYSLCLTLPQNVPVFWPSAELIFISGQKVWISHYTSPSTNRPGCLAPNPCSGL